MANITTSLDFKFKSLKTYTSTEWLADSKKRYRQVYDQSEVSLMYAELAFHNKLFDRKDWYVPVSLQAYEGLEEGLHAQGLHVPKQLCNIERTVKVSKDQAIVHVREGFGDEESGTFWKEGAYFWRAFIDGTRVGSHTFYVYDVGKTRPPAYFSLEQTLLYEGGKTDQYQKNAPSLREFDGQHTRFVWTNMSIINQLDRPWMGEFVLNFLNSARQLKGHVKKVLEIPVSEDPKLVGLGWGSDHQGTWFPGEYTAELLFMDQLIAVIPFRIGNQFVEGKAEPILFP